MTCMLQVNLHVTEALDGDCRLPGALYQAVSVAFDLTMGPMVKATLIPLKDRPEQVLLLSMHYAVTVLSKSAKVSWLSAQMCQQG